MAAGGSIADRFEQSVDRWGDQDFLCVTSQTAGYYRSEPLTWTFAQTAARVENVRNEYRSGGVGAHTRVGLALDNRPEFFVHLLALNGLGASAVPLNAGMQDAELEYLITHSECALLTVYGDYRERFATLSQALAQPLPVATPTTLTEAELETRRAPRRGDNLTEAAVIYTSGTTGQPKGCVLSNDYFRHIGRFYSLIGGLCAFRPGDRLMTPLPVSHMNALATSFMGCMQTGSCLIQLDRFHPSNYWDTVRASGATIIHYLGVMPALLLAAPASESDAIGDQVRFGFGAGCDPRHHARFEARFGFPLTEAWAMSETGAGAWITASHEPRHVGQRCFGKAPQGLDYRLVDEQGKEVPGGTVGELLVRRSGSEPRKYFFSGYLKDEAATREAWAGGWFHTGDEVRVDEAGSFFFVDRRKNIIRRSGENIAALEVETVLLRHPEVTQCVVTAVPDELRGDEVAALVLTGAEDQENLAEALFRSASAELAYYKAPGYIAFVQKLPLTASEKVKRGDVKRLAADVVAAGACFDFTARKKPPRPAA